MGVVRDLPPLPDVKDLNELKKYLNIQTLILQQLIREFNGNTSLRNLGILGMTGTKTFYTSATSGGAANVLNTVIIENGIIKSWY